MRSDLCCSSSFLSFLDIESFVGVENRGDDAESSCTKGVAPLVCTLTKL
jgi:hypothetical protein